MQVIPVIDLLNNQVVYAQRGKRDTYQPIESPLVSSAEPYAVVEAMLDYYPFEALYIADLTSIQQKTIESRHYALIETLCKRYPFLSLWVDAGAVIKQDIQRWLNLPIRPVLGSENFKQFDDYEKVMRSASAPDIISLDFINEKFMGDVQILEQVDLWPATVITMTLDNVGADNGPNWNMLKKIRATNQQSNVIAAGGIKNAEDLMQLKQQKVDGALIATALHQKRISAQEIASLKK